MIRQFDARGLKCPIPVLKARKLIKELQPGDILEVDATDPGAPKDFAHFCDVTGNKLLDGSEPEPGVFRIRVEVVGK
jgi:tRNA 2-thiouridine synthesizing protein A